MSNLTQIQEEIHTSNDPMSVFLYALKAPESRRQYPKRLKVLFDYIGLVEPLENQAVEFVKRAKVDSNWALFYTFYFLSKTACG